MGQLIGIQEKMLCALRPAQWLGVCHEQNRASVEIFIGKDVAVETLQSVWRQRASAHNQYTVHPTDGIGGESRALLHTPNSRPIALRPLFFRTKLGWLDVVDVEVQSWDDSSNIVTLTSSSTSWVPAVIPLAPVLGILFFWIPFFDHGANLRHLKLLHEDLERGCQCSLRMKVLSNGKIMRPVEYVIVLCMFGLTVIGTYLNVCCNPYLALNIVVSILCGALTIHTFITLICAFLVSRMPVEDSSSTFSDLDRARHDSLNSEIEF